MKQSYHESDYFLEGKRNDSLSSETPLYSPNSVRSRRANRYIILIALNTLLAIIFIPRLISSLIFDPLSQASQVIVYNANASSSISTDVTSSNAAFLDDTNAIPAIMSSTPSHSPHPKAKNVRIHFLNHHFGTSSELKAVVKAVSARNNVKIDLKETWGVFETVRDLHVPKAKSDEYWPTARREECNADKYDMVIVGDTISLIRPHLQNCCPLKLVSLLTTRYDWAHESDKDWKNLLVNSSHWTNFRVIPNNLIEPWFAQQKGANILMKGYLPSSGLPSDLWAEALKSIDNKVSTPRDDELIVPMSVRTEECLTSQLRKRDIQFTSFERSKHGGPLGLTDKIVVHFPYQSNVMSLFENLHQRVIYLVPTLRLFREMAHKCEARLEQIDTKLLSDEDFYTKVDWWRRDMKHLFYYFDSYDELKAGSQLRLKIEKEANHKRNLITKHMKRQEEYVLEQWEELLFGDWTNEGQADPQCQAYRRENV